MTINANKIDGWVVKDVAKYDGCTHDYLIDGKSPFYGTTREEYIAMGYSVLTDAELDALNKQFKENLSNDWTEVSEEKYEEALNILPPAKWYNGGFFVSEPYYDSLYPFYQSFHGKYYHSIQDIRKPRMEIMNSLVEYLNNE